ncbi:hypothetical protein AWB76_03289 [Caballeronia temeraria]|uniref:Uncharacterized protein n=2 Tax=Caballeronia temeraria TaxID=1777137 RepID=A0A158AY54_9BURK|nr:hypothetical protein AWB76_03289 [Caballeronia temeraria]
MGGGADAVAITNWQQMEQPLGSGVLYGVNQVWENQQANADVWARQAVFNDDKWREQQKYLAEASATQQKEGWATWLGAQTGYAIAQTLLADNALKAAQDQAEKQYDIANRQQLIAEQEYARYSEHFAPCENATVDEECARPEYTEPIEDEANRAAVDIRVQFGNVRQQLDRRRNRYCIGAYFAADRTLAIEQARAVGEGKERARRYLEDRQFNRQFKYFDRKMAILNLGRGIKADATSIFGNAAQTFDRGGEIEIAARNNFNSAVLSSIGGVLGMRK